MKIYRKLIIDIETGEKIFEDSYEYSAGLPIDKCCGPTNSEYGLQASSSAFANLLQSTFKTSLGNQNTALARLNSVISQIQGGTSVPGYGAAENAARRGEIINTGAAAARNAEQAVANAGAGQTFGSTDSGRTSAVRQAINAGIEGRASANTANMLSAETAANYATGRENEIATASGLSTLAGQYGSQASSASGNAITENAQSFGQAKTIQEQQAAEEQAIAGAIVGGGMDILSGGMTGLVGTGGEGLGGKLGDFGKGVLGV